MDTNTAKVIWDKLKAKGYSDIAAAAILGNWEAESNLSSVRVQNDYSEGYSNSSSYTNKVNSKNISEYDFVHGGPGGGGYGLAQWTDSTRKQGLYNYSIGHGYSVGDLNTQIEFADAEMTGEATNGWYGNVKSTVNSMTDLKTATTYILKNYEQPYDQGVNAQNTRYEYASYYYEKFAGSAPSTPAPEQNTAPARTEPVYYSQRDSQWGSQLYSYKDHDYSQTIAESACGPTCAAMVVATLVDPSVTPPDACQWALTHSASTDTGVYRTWENGTAGSFFPAYFESYGIPCETTGTYDGVIAALEQGFLVVVHCNNMGGGHYILAYGIDEDGYILVNDPYFDGDPRYYEEGKAGKLSPSMLASLMSRGQGGYIISEQWTSINPSSSGQYFNNTGGAFSNSTAASSIEYKEVTVDIKTSTIVTADVDPNTLRTKSNSLLDTPTLVESPFIILKIGEYTFGSYSIDGSFETLNSNVRVTYPNYMTRINIVKINGQVNQYTITMVYQIENGNDPNLLDKVFSSVGYGTVYISYGDWNAPKFAYRDEEAIITKLDSNVDFANSRITYTLHCTSNALVLLGGYYNFPANNAKPSEVIHDMIYGGSKVPTENLRGTSDPYGLQTIFNGFKDDEMFFWNCVAGDDVSVELLPKLGMDALSYVNYLVTCMSPTTTPKFSAIRDANYYLTICEDRDRGTYFTVKKVASSGEIISLNNSDVYEVDVGYPGDTLVTNFSIKNDNSWSLLYNYSQNVNMESTNYVYNIDNQGNIYGSYSPNVTTSARYIRTTETQKNWWTQMTQFPITAVLTIKGLLRPAMLMSYVRINAMFYGLRHVSSGLYIITKQEDTIDQTGYRTTLTLQRIAGDLDVIVTDTKTVTKVVPVISYNTNNLTLSGGNMSQVSSDKYATPSYGGVTTSSSGREFMGGGESIEQLEVNEKERIADQVKGVVESIVNREENPEDYRDYTDYMIP